MLTDILLCDKIGFDPNKVYFSNKVIDLHWKQIWNIYVPVRVNMVEINKYKTYKLVVFNTVIFYLDPVKYNHFGNYI